MSLLTGHGEYEDYDYDNYEDHGVGKFKMGDIKNDRTDEKLAVEKPYCKRCKHKEFSQGSAGVLLCHVGRHLDPMGNWLYPKCRDKNKDFQCKDFLPRWPWKRLYKKQEMTK